MNPEEKMEFLTWSAKELNKARELHNITYSYISEKTGENEEAIKRFFALRPCSAFRPYIIHIKIFKDFNDYLNNKNIELKVRKLFFTDMRIKPHVNYDIIQDEIWFDLIDSARDMDKFRRMCKTAVSYISNKSGIPYETVTNYFRLDFDRINKAINESGYKKYLEYKNIENRLRNISFSVTDESTTPTNRILDGGVFGSGIKWDKLISLATELDKLRKRFDISYLYISEKTGEPEEKIKDFFSLNPNSKISTNDYFYDTTDHKRKVVIYHQTYYEYKDIGYKIKGLFLFGMQNKNSRFTAVPEKLWGNLSESSKELNSLKKRFNMSYSFISEKTGVPEEKIKIFFSLNPDNGENSEYPDKK